MTIPRTMPTMSDQGLLVWQTQEWVAGQTAKPPRRAAAFSAPNLSERPPARMSPRVMGSI